MKNKPENKCEGTRTRGSNPGGGINWKREIVTCGKKEEIRKLTTEILDMATKYWKRVGYKKKTYLNAIASYSDSTSYDLDILTDAINA